MLDGDPSLVLSLYARLPSDSMTRAQERGGEHGWVHYMEADPTYYLLAGIYDAINVNTAATGWYAKGKAPKFDPWTLPEHAAKKAKERAERSTALGVYKALGGQLPTDIPKRKRGQAAWAPIK